MILDDIRTEIRNEMIIELVELIREYQKDSLGSKERQTACEVLIIRLENKFKRSE